MPFGFMHGTQTISEIRRLYRTFQCGTLIILSSLWLGFVYFTCKLQIFHYYFEIINHANFHWWMLHGFLFHEFYDYRIGAFSAASAKINENVLAFCYRVRVKMINYALRKLLYCGNWFPFVQIGWITTKLSIRRKKITMLGHDENAYEDNGDFFYCFYWVEFKSFID